MKACLLDATLILEHISKRRFKMKMHDLPKTGFVRQSQLIPHLIPVSSSTLWRMVKNGSFPKPIKLSARTSAWRVEDVREWIESVGKESQ